MSTQNIGNIRNMMVINLHVKNIHIIKNSKYLTHNQDTNYTWRITTESHKRMTWCHYRVYGAHPKI